MPRTPAAGGRPSSVTVRAAPHRATFPKGKAMCSAQSTGEPRSGTNYFCARLHFFLPRSFCVSLPQSFVAAKRQQNPALPPRRPPLTLRLRYLAFADGSGLPPRCIRHRRRSKAKPLRGSRGRSRAVHRFAAAALRRSSPGFAAVRNAALQPLSRAEGAPAPLAQGSRGSRGSFRKRSRRTLYRGVKDCAQYTHSNADKDPLRHLPLQSSAKCQLPLQARGAKNALSMPPCTPSIKM